MTDAGGHAAPPAHPPGDHDGGETAGHDAHAGRDPRDGDEPLGPIDAQAWLAGIVGVAIGLVTALCFVLATAGLGAY